ncbi:flagellar hook-associated protein 2 [Neobacillus sp. PS3-12]|uniref:flagellar hook-associated protein 2 n=1 Tax=Neobacillus sp. PS3-12 TaxID=3070677 RepID=UPI0027E01E28|nr:flagellar hook-associated protein 2 [Neobacillus sp. PS3-12]WML54743.1 flagellar hook-associated protein 2 [Neobacillus sp. PS3-12]
MATTGTTSSGTIASQYSGLMRVNGMASGMDIDGMVSKLMKAEALPLDKMKQNQQLLQWKRDDYRDMNTSLSDLDTTIFDGIMMNSTFNKKTVTSSDSNYVTATALNSANNTSTQIEVSNLATAATWKSSGTIGTLGGSDKTLTFSVADPRSSTPRDVTISISGTDTIDDIIQKFNNSKLDMTAMKGSIKDSKGNYVDNTIVLSNNKTGSGSSIIPKDQQTADFMTNLGFTINSSTDLNTQVTTYSFPTSTAGDDAIVSINGYEMKESSNNFTVNGINYTIKNKTTAPVTVSTATDVDTIYNSIKGFVDKYNDVIKKVNDKISEKRERDFPPLTDDQRASMNDTQISQWEAKAKSGMLSNDSILSSGLSKMRQDLYSPVTGSSVTTGYTQLSQIGITTSSDYSDNGKLVIDETKLRQAIQDNPQAIYQLFNSGVRSNDASGNYTYETEGLAKRLRDTIANASSQVTTIAGQANYTNNQFDIGKQLTDISTQITDFQSKLTDIENRYYSQFSAMEQAMQQANNQASYISQNFSAG